MTAYGLETMNNIGQVSNIPSTILYQGVQRMRVVAIAHFMRVHHTIARKGSGGGEPSDDSASER